MRVLELIKVLETMPKNMQVYTCKLGEMPVKIEYVCKESDLEVVVIHTEG